jgi:hypothetical protein
VAHNMARLDAICHPGTGEEEVSPREWHNMFVRQAANK